MEGINAHPLTWPVSWRRTPPHQRKRSRYQVSFGRARDEVVHSLGLMGVSRHDVIISTNVPLRRDGLPYADMREPDDPGVAVYWSKIGKQTEQRVIPCDSWRTVRDNLRAVGLALEALRQLERTGAKEILDRAFTGFAALPPAPSEEEDWRRVLFPDGSWKLVTKERIEERYRELSLVAHPDRGGSHDAMVRLNRARDQALAFLAYVHGGLG
jgi:hypothetical protein